MIVEDVVNLTKHGNSDRIYNCHMNKEVLFMFYSEQQVVDACTEEPSLVFTLIKRCDFNLVEKLLDENRINVNVCDGAGNDVVMRL